MKSTTPALPTSADVPTLHMICGKIASGKSTLASRLADQPRTLLISEDEWLGTLYPGTIKTVADYVQCAARLRNVMGKHVEQLLRAGNSVVLDFPANTLSSRQWMREIFEHAGVAHCLHYLNASDTECKRRLQRRNEDDAHQFKTSDAEFDLITQYFVAPALGEGFNVVEQQMMSR